jgi:hypothetical protein
MLSTSCIGANIFILFLIDGNGISDAGAIAVAEASSQHQHLHELSLGKVTDNEHDFEGD